MTDRAETEPHRVPPHRWHEDVQAFALGTSIVGFGLLLLTHAGLITGQTAGLAVLISYVTGWSFGAVFFVVNLPFYWLAWQRMGVRFTVKTFVAVAMLSVISELLPRYLAFETLATPVAALYAGAVTGLGLIVLFRHGASLGGLGVAALYLQDRTGFQAGWTQQIFDACLFAAAIFVLPWEMVAWSLLGAVVVNLIVAVNHRRDRYLGR